MRLMQVAAPLPHHPQTISGYEIVPIPPGPGYAAGLPHVIPSPAPWAGASLELFSLSPQLR